MEQPVWNVRNADAAEVARVASALDVPPAVARVLWLRGYTTPRDAVKFLETRDSLAWLETPIEGPQFLKAVARIKRAVETKEPFVIYGDYDCDGVTSAAVLYRYLKRGLNANCEAYLPDRFKDGYGVTAAAVERIADRGIKLILTCDNGISAVAAAEAAKRRGVEIVVTDHHQPPEELPDVHAIVHPALEFRHLKDLAGVGVALLFVVALEGGYTARMEHFVDIATIGTIGDVVPLDGPNRPLVWAGLERYRAGKHRFPGLQALAEVARTDFPTVRAEDIAFQLCPRLNAAGRLETPDVGFKLLATNDKAEAAAHAETLDGINRQRKELSAELQAEIYGRIDGTWDIDAEPFIVLADETFHHGITGIIAGRVKDRYRVPVMLFSGHDDGAWKASGRSPEGLHLYEALHAARGHLLGFGGHAQAAGCSALRGSIPEIRKQLNLFVQDSGWTRPRDMVTLDAELPFKDADGRLLAALDRLEPFGQRNPAPVFGLLRARVVGTRVVKGHLFLNVDDGESVREIVAWGKGELAGQLGTWVRLTYKPRYNNFRGETKIQLIADRLEPTSPPPPVAVRRAARSGRLDLADKRGQAVDDAKAMIYALAPPEGAEHRWLGPLDLPPTGLVHLVLRDLPADEAALGALVDAADKVTLAWDPAGAPEAPLTAEWLGGFWSAVEPFADLPLPEALAAAALAEDWRAWAAVGVLREAGLLVERPGFFQLLAPGGPVALEGLASFAAAAAARAFRAELRAAPLATIRALAAGEVAAPAS